MRIGMDFGTTNSGIAVYDGAQIRVLSLDPVTHGSTMRSVIYLTRDRELFVGQKAILLYNSQNINRKRHMIQKKVGRIRMELGEAGNLETDVHITIDELEPGRLLRSLKSALATPYTGTRIFEHDYTLEQMIALYLRACRDRAAEELGAPVTAVTMGRPVHFVGAETAEDDLRAEDRLRVAAKLAGFEQIDFEFEPVAAARHYAQSLSAPQTILVYDFGGGTLDVTVMKVTPGQSPEILSIGGLGIAGDRFDQRVIEHGLTPHFGRDVTWGDKKLPVPRNLIDQLTAWEGLASLATIENRMYLHRLQTDCSAVARLYALESLIFNFYGFALFETVETTKRILSDATVSEIRFVGTDIDIWQPLTRAQFEQFTQTEWRQIRNLVNEVVADAGLTPAQIDAVVRTGGSSSIPASLSVLAEIFGTEKLITEDLFTGVTAGLSLVAWERDHS
jgi:hypothetical chaperone protein